jgi:phage terminase large subunit
MYDFNFNKIFSPVFFKGFRVCDIAGGRGRGGSHFITDYFLFRMLNPEYFRGYFMRFIFGDIRKSLYQDFKDRLDEHEEIDPNLFEFNDTRMEITCNSTGNKVFSLGFRKSQGSAKAKLKSIAGATDIAIEECEEVPEDDFNKLQDSLRTVKGKLHIFRIWNPPPKNHWLVKNYLDIQPHPIYKDYYTATSKEIEGYLYIFATYKDNLKNINTETAKNFEKYKDSNVDHYCSDILGLISGGAKGQIFKEWKLYDQLPDDTIFYKLFGIDWGGNDPNTFMELNFDRKQRRLFIKEHLYEPEIRDYEFKKLVKRIAKGHEVVADSARRDRRNEFANYGINIFPSDKSKINDDFRHDIIQVIKQYEIYLHRESKNLIYEAENYKWALNANKEPLNKPEDANNHCWDAVGYGVRYYHNNFSFHYKD